MKLLTVLSLSMQQVINSDLLSEVVLTFGDSYTVNAVLLVGIFQGFNNVDYLLLDLLALDFSAVFSDGVEPRHLLVVKVLQVKLNFPRLFIILIFLGRQEGDGEFRIDNT